MRVRIDESMSHDVERDLAAAVAASEAKANDTPRNISNTAEGVNGPAALRKQLRRAGFVPLPVIGKAPPLEGWSLKTETNDGEIDLWSSLYHYAPSTGVSTQKLPAIDLDILNEEAAEAAEALVRERFEEKGYILVRIGRAPKRAIPFRTDSPFKKITVNLTARNGDTGQKIELLADGQQLVAFGTHPDTGKPYRWHGGEPGEITREELPYIHEAEARQLVNDVADLLCREHGYERAKARPKKETNGINDGGGSADWGFLVENIRAGRDLHDSLRDLAAKLVRSGMSAGAAVNFLRGLMDETPEGARDERWKDRRGDISRLVDSAQGFSSRQPAQQPKPRKTSVVVCAADIKARPKQWVWEGHLLKGAQELLTGQPGLGKSQTQISFVACVTNPALPWPDGTCIARPAMDVLMLTAEDTLDQEVQPRLMAAGADLKRVHILKWIHNEGKNRQFLLGEDLDELENILVQIGNVGLVTVDPITAYMGGKVDSHKATEVRSQLGPLKDFAEKNDVAVSTITHPPKSSGSLKAIDQFIGSQAFIATGRIGHLCLGEYDDEGKPTERILFANAKNNAHVKMPMLAFRLEQVVTQNDPLIMAPRVVWEPGTIPMTADEAMAASAQAPDGRQKEQKKLQSFLAERLQDGPQLQTKIEKEAKAAGFSEKQLRYARTQLGVVSEKTRFGPEGAWMWNLPLPL
jgi:hypothetical protein